ncbi:unnamed protein product [Diatraea saccharalis]|uniref:Uncharacterized protein n=1 Tax=Diatraea saccharalis TaxID=40085 RepID=A0A9N9RF68_9NEOP|nr:unnamed protein product [Diatraea saccharalis]
MMIICRAYYALVLFTREQLTVTQRELKKMRDEYADTVPRRDYDCLMGQLQDQTQLADSMREELNALKDIHKRTLNSKKSVEEELFEIQERCSELERAGTPRPQWELCADFIGGGRDRFMKFIHFPRLS